jgi:ferredoxin
MPRLHGHDDPSADRITIKWLDIKTNEVLEREATVGSTLLEAAHRSGIDLEGACEGSIACSTCHVVLEPTVFEALPEASEDEDDMLDSAFGLTETSRLGCQVCVTNAMHGAVVALPVATRNFYVDGHVPKPH